MGVRRWGGGAVGRWGGGRTQSRQTPRAHEPIAQTRRTSPGASLSPPSPGASSLRRHDRPWMGEASLANLSAELRDAPEPLVTLAFMRPLWLDGFDRWLQLSPPLLAARNASVRSYSEGLWVALWVESVALGAGSSRAVRCAFWVARLSFGRGRALVPIPTHAGSAPPITPHAAAFPTGPGGASRLSDGATYCYRHYPPSPTVAHGYPPLHNMRRIPPTPRPFCARCRLAHPFTLRNGVSTAASAVTSATRSS